MKVRDLIDILSHFNPDADLVIARDVMDNGYGFIDSVVPGVFAITDYGNDFYPDGALCVSLNEAKAVCIFPECGETATRKPREIIPVDN